MGKGRGKAGSPKDKNGNSAFRADSSVKLWRWNERGKPYQKEINIMEKTIEMIKSIMEKQEYYAYGLRVDFQHIPVGEKFPNSHNWYQDQFWDEDFLPDDWEEPAEDPATGLWDGGELDGVCTVGIDDTDELAEKLQFLLAHYYYGQAGAEICIIGGQSAESGNDPYESVIGNGICLAKFTPSGRL